MKPLVSLRLPGLCLVAALVAGMLLVADPPPARALDAANTLCKAAGLLSGVAGKACGAVAHPGRVIDAGKKLAGGHLAAAAKSLLGDGSGGGALAAKAVGLAAVGAWVIGGASFALRETGRLMSSTTRPNLSTTWFSTAYWRMAGIGALLALPFLFAAAMQAVFRSDIALLGRAALGYLPLAMLAVAIAAPLTTLLLSASDELSSAVSFASGNSGTHFLERAGLAITGLAAISRSPFIAFLVGLFTAAGALVLWLELLVRDAAVYVIVLMLPVVFAGLVWPARRIWAVRATELLVALILSKFAIVAVLALGGEALTHPGSGLASVLAGLVLVTLGAFAPWALLRLLPLHELAAGAAGSMRAEARPATRAGGLSQVVAADGDHWVRTLHARMNSEARDADGFAQSPRAELPPGTSEETAMPNEPGDPAAPAPPDPAAPAAPAPAEHAAAPAAGEGPRSADGRPDAASPGTDEAPERPIFDPDGEVLELGPEGEWCRYRGEPDPPLDEDPFAFLEEEDDR